MPTVSTELLIELAYALAIGSFIGFEREHSDVAPGEVALGVRTFALLAMLGWVLAIVGERYTWMPVAGVVVVGAFIAVEYKRSPEDRGMTTEIAALVTYGVGILAHLQRPLAVTVGIATTLLLISKPWVRTLVASVRRYELTATVQLVVVLAVVLPLLPAEPVDPWDSLSPRRIGVFVILIAGISYVGYILSRIFGERRGLGLTGILGGLASSTAVTVSMARAAKSSAAAPEAYQAATLVANAVMCVRVIVIAAAIATDVAARIAAPLGLMGAILVGAGLRAWLRRSGEADKVEPAITNPFALLPALKWGIILCVVLLLAAWGQAELGDRGVYAAALLSGLADVDAITLALTESAAEQSLMTEVATLGVAIAVMSNMVVKGGLALFSGGRRFGTRVVIYFAIASAAGIGLAVVMR